MTEILQENTTRNELLDEYYNPTFGVGSLIDRFPFKITEGLVFNLPVEMKEDPIIKIICEYDSIEKFIKGNKNIKQLEPTIQLVLDTRDKYDFEYWAFSKVKIKPKDGGDLIPFKLNKPQRRVLARLEKMRLARKPIRMIILKARQWGGSTLVQLYMAWIQILHKTNWNSLIAAEINQQATNIRYMYSNMVKHYPGKITLKPFEGMSNIKIIPERSNKITVGSMQTPESVRSDDVAMAHLSEVAFWKKTEGKEPKDLAQAILGTIPSKHNTLYVLESTAKGVGNYFHNVYTNAVEQINNLDPVFVPWFEIEIYRDKFEDKQELTDFHKSLDDYEIWLWSIGATLEGIKWYRGKLREFDGDTWRMRSEFPSSAIEAFQSTGRRVYAPSIVEKTRLNCVPPQFKGHLYADGNKGDDALKNISFEESANGELWIWELPDKSITVDHRYLVTIDIGGKSKDADWSVIRVLDRYWMMYAGVPEFVATYKIHIDQDLLAWLAVQVGEFYNHAMVAFENNSLRKYENTEGAGFLTLLNEVAEHYDNLYIKSSPQDAVKEGMPVKYGFHTNRSSKDMIINYKNAAMRDDEYIERDSRACDESDQFERKSDDTVGAVDGGHDDIEMSTDISLWISQYDMPLPYIVDLEKAKENRLKNRKRIINESSF